MSDDLKLLKERIYEDEKITYLLEELECEYIQSEQAGKLITAKLPDKFDSKNKRSIQIKNNESLTTNIRSRGITGDIYSLVGFILYDCETFDDVRANLYQIKTWICNTLEYDEFLKPGVKPEKKVNWNAWLQDIKKQREGIYTYEENKVINESELDRFINLPNIWWYEEGLSLKTQEEFGLGYDIQSQRITIPVHNKNGDLIGVKGRYVGKSQEILDQYKYIYLIPCNKSIEMFNLHRASPYIQEQKEIIIVEGAKTCMFLWQWGYRNCVSIEGDHLVPVQVQLLRELGLDIKLTFAWDKGKNTEFIKKQVKQIKAREVFSVFDTKNLLEDRDSPTDKGLEVWQNLYKQHKYKIK